MKRNNFIVIIVLQLLTINLAAQRAVLGIRGMSTTSSGSNINGLINGAKNEGYKINYLGSVPFNYDPSAGVVASSALIKEELQKQDANDVLGIGHDYGGIVLKNMNSSQVSAMILDGVPNNGSEAIQKMIEKDGSGKFRVQKLFSDLKTLSGAGDCATCNFETRLNEFIDDIQSNSKAWKDVTPNSPLLGKKPSVPYAILWGNIGDKGLSSLISSYISPSNTATNFIGGCITESAVDKKIRLSRARNGAIVAAVFNTYSSVKSLLTPISVVTKDGAGNELSAPKITGLGFDKVKTLVTGLVSDIDKIKGACDDLKKLLKCEVYMQLINAQWEFLTSGDQFTTHKYNIVNIGDPQALQDCLANCTDPDNQVEEYCESNCYSTYNTGNTTTTITVTYYLNRPHDGLLTDLEQKLDGAAKTYELKGINHYQEIDWKQDAVSNVLTDLFEGGSGVAFKVPK